MPRARTSLHSNGTAVTPQDQGSGCSLFILLPPLSVLLISGLLAPAAWNAAPHARPNLPPAISKIFTPEVLYWSESITHWSAGPDLDPNLVATVMQIESCGDPQALSSSGAIGLFQVMPFHFEAHDDPYKPGTNAVRGLAYLARALKAARGDARLALAGYNGGIGVIDRGEWAWSAQTKRYVQYGWPIYREAREGLDTSAALAEWHARYGAGLCRQARSRLGLP